MKHTKKILKLEEFLGVFYAHIFALMLLQHLGLEKELICHGFLKSRNEPSYLKICLTFH